MRGTCPYCGRLVVERTLHEFLEAMTTAGHDCPGEAPWDPEEGQPALGYRYYPVKPADGRAGADQ